MPNPEDLIPYLAKTAHKLANLGLFWTVAAIVAQFLPPNAAAMVEVIVSSLFLALVGSIVVSAFLGGRGFDHPGSGFVLALAGFLLGHFVFGWDLRKPCGHADVIPGNSFYKEQYVTFKDHTEIFFAMLLIFARWRSGWNRGGSHTPDHVETLEVSQLNASTSILGSDKSCFKFHKRGQLFICTHDEAISVVAMRVYRRGNALVIDRPGL